MPEQSEAKSLDYRQWLVDLKQRLRSVQIKAAVSVNSALIEFYWDLGADIVEKQKDATWGDGFLAQLSLDLMAEFPQMQGFSKRNLELVRRWVLFYQGSIAKQAVSQLASIPWGHNLVIVSKCKTPKKLSATVAKRWNTVGAVPY